MKKYLLILIAVVCLGFSANAQTPNFDGITLCSKSGETLDFYTDKVVYHAKNASISRVGSYKWMNIGRWNGQMSKWEASITIELSMSNTTKTLKGKIVYDTRNGDVISMKIDNVEYTKENCY